MSTQVPQKAFTGEASQQIYTSQLVSQQAQPVQAQEIQHGTTTGETRVYQSERRIDNTAQHDGTVVSQLNLPGANNTTTQVVRRSLHGASLANLGGQTVLVQQQQPYVVNGTRKSAYGSNLVVSSVVQQPYVVNGTRKSAYATTTSSGVVRQGEARVISENVMPSRLIEQTQGAPQVVDVKYGQSYEVNRSVHIGTDVRVRENRLEVREQRPSFTQSNLNKDVTVRSEKAVFNQRVVEKTVDVYIEKPVPVYREVEVPYDVIIEKPIEKVIERDVITEIIMEKPIEKIVEIPVTKVVEVPIQKTIERPVYFDRIVEVPREVIVDRHREVIVETPVFVEKVIECDERDISKYKYDRVLPTEVKVFEKPVYKENRVTHRNVIEKAVEVPVEKIVHRSVQRMVERPVEKIVERPVYVDNIVERVVEVPVENIIYNRVEQIVEEPEYIEQIIDKPVHVERVVERPVETIEEVLIERPVYIDRVVEKEVDRVIEKEVRIDREVQVPVQRFVERPVYKERVVHKEVPKIIEQEVIYETTIPVERVNVVEEVIPVPIDRIIERPVERTVERYVDVVVEKEVYEDNVVEDVQYVERIVHVPLERIVERPVFRENVIEKNVYMEKIVEREVDVPVEKIVEVPVERIVEIPVEVIVENPVPRQRIVEREVFIDKKVSKPRASHITTGSEDASLRFQVQTLERQISETKITVSKLRAEWEYIQKKSVNLTLRSDIDYTTQNTKLRELIADMESKIRNFKPAVTHKSMVESTQVVNAPVYAQQRP